MPEVLAEMPFLKNIGVLMTYRCQVACPHCIIEAGPHRKEEILLEEAIDWTQQVASYRNGHIKVLSLTGGEPFINEGNLRAISDYGESCGLLVSVVTNAFWAKSEDRAVQTLKTLPAIKMLAISCDTYHQATIPFNNVKNAILAAKTCELAYNISVCTQNTEDPAYKQLLQELLELTDSETINTAITFPAGRAVKALEISRYKMSKNPPPSACSAGSSPIIFPDGKVVACIGPVISLSGDHPLLLGDLRKSKLEEILNEADGNAVLHAIRVWGPSKLISLIKETELRKALPDVYIDGSVCNACYALMANPHIAGFLRNLNEERAFAEKVAYARSYYLKEVSIQLLDGGQRRGVRIT
jgi:MoaA/NifB/PqqE/SkfB family radical SAM enzyme